MWFKKLKKKKLQCFLIGVLLFLSALIFTSSLSLITSINGYVENYYGNAKYYSLIVYDANESAKDEVLNWGKNNPKVKDIKTLEAFDSGNNMYNNGEKISLSDYDIVPLEDYENIPFGLTKILSLNGDSSPKEGDIWVTQLFADTHKISLGDSIEFKTNDKTVSLKVTSLVNDSLQPSNLMGKTLFYTNKKSTLDLSTFKKTELVFVAAAENVNISDLGKDLNTAINIGGLTGDKNLLITASTMVSSILGGVSVLASLLVFVVSIFIIRFILWNNILKEYKSIGIYKALGFTKREILKFYIIGYSLTALLGSAFGALCSIPVLNLVAAKVIKYIGDFKGVTINFAAILITIFLFSLIVVLNLYFVIKKTNKISPVEALRTGVTSSRKKLTKSIIKNNTSPLALAINDIFKYKKVTVYISLSLILSLVLIIIFGNFNITTLNMKDNSNVWFGAPKSNVYISLNAIVNRTELNAVLNDIKTDPKVKGYTYGSLLINNVKLDK